MPAAPAPFKWKHAPSPTDPDAIRILEKWPEQNITTFACETLARVTGGKYRLVTLNHQVRESFLALWAAWEKAGLLEMLAAHMKTLGLSLRPNGYWVARYKRGTKVYNQNPARLSNHASGHAFDLCAAAYPLGRRIAQTDPLRHLFPIAAEHGWTNGADWLRADPMHWQHELSPFR